jgi:hypothetical protein
VGKETAVSKRSAPNGHADRDAAARHRAVLTSTALEYGSAAARRSAERLRHPTTAKKRFLSLLDEGFRKNLAALR